MTISQLFNDDVLDKECRIVLRPIDVVAAVTVAGVRARLEARAPARCGGGWGAVISSAE